MIGKTTDVLNQKLQMPSLETIKFQDIPQSILNEVLECLKHFAAPITVFEDQKDSFVGSCTFVELKDRHFLFTAAHVWEALEPFSHIGIVVGGIPSHTVKICTQTLKPTVIGKRENGKWNEWGPDIAFLELAESDIIAIKAFKSFWNLGGGRAMQQLPKQEIKRGAWVIMGLPDERINFCRFEMRASFCVEMARHAHSRYDYVDLGVDTTIANALREHVGMSGGGLWRVCIIRNRAGKLAWLPKELSLEGVIFWERRIPTVNGYGIIRCHGRKSLYSEGLNAIDASVQ